MKRNGNDYARQRLTDAAQECERHLYHMRNAMEDLAPFQPFVADSLSRMGDAEIRGMDQFVYRFTKLQDAMGLRLLPAVLRALGEPLEDWSMIDRLNRLEQLGFVESPDAWRLYREVRNRLTHEYPDAPEIQAAVLNHAWQVADELKSVFGRILRRLEESGISPP